MVQRRPVRGRNRSIYMKKNQGKREIRTKHGRGVRFSPLGCIVRLILLLAVIFIIVLFTRSSVFDVQTITVEGLVSVDESEIVHLSGLQIGENLFRVDQKRAEEQISLHASLADVHVKKRLPHTIVIEVTERQPVAQLLNNGIYYIISADGAIIAKGDGFNVALPLLTALDLAQTMTVGMQFTNTKVEAGLMLADAMKDRFPETRKEIVVTSPSDISCYFNGKEVRFGDADDLDDKLEAMSVSLKALPEGGWARLEYVDVSDPREPVVKMTEEEGETTEIDGESDGAVDGV